MSWLKIKKIIVLKSCLLLPCTTTNLFSIELRHAMKSGLHTTTSTEQLRGWTKKKLQSASQSQTCTIKRSWSLSGGLLPVWSTTAFWIPMKPLHLRSMLSTSVRCTKNCNTCSWHWSTERAQFFSTTVPDHMSHGQHFKSWMNWASSAIFTWPLTNWLPRFQTSLLLAWKTFRKPAGDRKCFPRVCRIPRHGFFRYRNKQNLFLIGKNVLIV